MTGSIPGMPDGYYGGDEHRGVDPNVRLSLIYLYSAVEQSCCLPIRIGGDSKNVGRCIVAFFVGPIFIIRGKYRHDAPASET